MSRDHRAHDSIRVRIAFARLDVTQFNLVRRERLELSRLSSPVPKTGVYTIPPPAQIAAKDFRGSGFFHQKPTHLFASVFMPCVRAAKLGSPDGNRTRVLTLRGSHPCR